MQKESVDDSDRVDDAVDPRVQVRTVFRPDETNRRTSRGVRLFAILTFRRREERLREHE